MLVFCALSALTALFVVTNSGVSSFPNLARASVLTPAAAEVASDSD